MTFSMDAFAAAIDLAAVLLLALGIKGLSKVSSARGANAISGITILASLTLIQQAGDNQALLLIGALSLGFALYNVIGGFLVTDRMLAMFRRKGDR